MNRTIDRETSIIATAIMIGLIILSGVLYFESNRFIKNQAIDGCYKTGQVTFTKNGQTDTVPENYWYNLCMETKGYTNTK
jgi:hypothetical protein